MNLGPVPAGQRDRRVTFQKAAAATDEYGGEGPTWSNHAVRWARVRFGGAQEKREAAQEGGVQSATFEVLPDPIVGEVALKDRIVFAGSNWDITEVAPLGSDVARFTATRLL